MLEQLNNMHDSNDTHHIVRLMDYIVFNKHLLLVFEPLSINLYELIKQSKMEEAKADFFFLYFFFLNYIFFRLFFSFSV